MSLLGPVWAWSASFSPVVTSSVADSESNVWPQDIVATRCEFRLQKNSIRNESPITRTTQILSRQGSRWMGTYTFLNVGNDYGRRMDALLVRHNSFCMHDHARPYPQNGVISGVVLTAGASRGATSVLVTGLPLSQTHIVAGDYLGIGGKLYMAVRDVTADSLGSGLIYLNRGLLLDVNAGEEVNFDRPTAEMILVDDDQNGRTVVPGYVYEYVLSFVEPGVVVN